MPPTATEPDRHAVLADPTRRALLVALRGGGRPSSVRDLAASLGLHANSVREQLARLQAAGLVRVSRASPAGRGRPGLRYEAVPEPEDPYRVLAGVLADQVASLPSPGPAAEAAGERWGRAAAAAALADAPGPLGDPLETVVALLAGAGFAPDPIGFGDDEIRLRACPFMPIDRRHLPVVCGVHLGFVRGALRELAASQDATAIEPLVRPDLCVARLERTPHA